jgi:hypothetical protein
VLAICEEQLAKTRGRVSGLSDAKERGIGWLARHFSASANPPETNLGEWLYYYLYGIERVGALCGLTYLGGSDWYREGADFMLRSQAENGSWSAAWGWPQRNTCFVLLFLNKATAPTTGGLPSRNATYGADDPAAEVSLRAAGDTPLDLWIASFGIAVHENDTWEGERQRGPRVLSVQYLLPPRELLAAGGTWSTSEGPPARDWQLPGFRATGWSRGAAPFGVGGGAPVTEWKGNELWLRREFELPSAALVDPELVLLAGTGIVAGGDGGGGPQLVGLYDEDQAFPGLLDGGSRDSEISERRDQAFAGQHALRVSGRQRFNASIPGWSFRITQKPQANEFRYLRFAWQKQGGAGIMLQLAAGGGWQNARRYFAGQNTANHQPALQVQSTMPTEWTVVTRDLYADFGGEATITGLALTPMDGEAAWFDGVYLAKRLDDFDRLAGRRHEVAGHGDDAASAPLQVWINGQSIYAGDLSGQRTLASGERLRQVLQPGTNLLAVQCRRPSDGAPKSLDFSLRDHVVLATVDGGGKPADQRAFAARQVFERPGDYDICARVQIQSPPRPGEASQTKTLRSQPLRVTIQQACDPQLLSYGTDPQRNLIPQQGVVARASSQQDEGTGPEQAIDNTQVRRWFAKTGDLNPWLELDLGQNVRADTVLLSPPPKRRAQARVVEIVLNDKDAYRVALREEPLRKTELRLPKPVAVRKLSIKVLAVSETSEGVGLAEVELQLQKR